MKINKSPLLYCKIVLYIEMILLILARVCVCVCVCVCVYLAGGQQAS